MVITTKLTNKRSEIWFDITLMTDFYFSVF